MARRQEQEPDNLWLLLDTICNAFGVMVLLSLYYAVHANDIRIAKSKEQVLEAIRQIESQIADSKTNFHQLNIELGKLASKTQFWCKIEGLSNDWQTLSLVSANLAAQLASNQWVLAHPELANAKLARLNLLSQQYASNSAALFELTRIYDGLTNDLFIAESRTVTNKIPFPQEHDVAKTPLHLILRYDSVYLTYDPSNKQGGVNVTGLQWTAGSTNRLMVTAIAGRGIAPNNPVLGDKLKAINPERTYLVCWVYNDSFGAFGQLKNNLQQLGIEYGWSPVEPHQVITVAADKIRPPPAQ
jgi:hypothetical protein